MRELLEDLMDAAARRAEYADARFVHTRLERLATRNGGVDRLDTRETEGIGVRVRVGGSWGFASTGGTSKADAEAALEQALAVAAAQPSAAGAELAPEPPARGDYESPFERDPFGVPLEEKLAVLVAADAGLRTEPGVVLTRASFEGMRVDKLFASTEGALCRQRLTECGGGLSAVAVDRDQSQIRSYPASHGGLVRQAGYEHFLTLDLAGEAPRVSEETVALLRAPACAAGRRTLVLAGEQLGTQIHESIGHAVELDRVLGREASYAGTSFMPAGAIGSLRVGSPLVNVTADAGSAGGLGSFRWDDEGVEGRAVPIVRDGVLAGFLSSRETAVEIGLERSGGCMRAEDHARQPIVRMTNVNLEPGEAGTLEDLIAATDDGLLIETNRSWSIDDRRLHFQFEGEAAWEIAGGERRRLLRNPSYAGVTPEFWASCDAVCSPSEWRLVSLLDCGKGEPGQIMRVSHGCAPARFRDVEVGVA
ncbi:MAG TPA: TldD/PmbA family protein [Thermoleophilaceae bacterium]|nr:TldD/PmbA family protein [Thermoleophilaceae bacterium]